MKILGIIPARGGSKGIPGKNIKYLGGKPLLQYTFDAAKESKLLTKIILSSDDPEIIEIARKIGLGAAFIRPKELARDNTPSWEVMKHALTFLEEWGRIYDAVCLLQPTTPFRQKGLIDEAIEKFRKGNYDSLISVREVPAEYNPHWIFEPDEEDKLKIATGEQEIISRRQELPKAYHRDGAIYITKTDVIMNKNSLFGNSIGYIQTKNKLHVNLDTPADWEEAEELIKKMEH